MKTTTSLPPNPFIAMTTTTFRLAPLALLATLTIAGCDSAGHDHDEGEVITRVAYTLTPSGGGTAQTATFNDANRNGVVDTGEITGVTLNAGRTYTGAVAVFGPNGEITSEIVGENDAHAFVYTVGGGASGRLAISSTDNDTNGLPFRRLATAAVSGTGAASGTVQLELVHFGDADTKQEVRGVPTAAMERDVNVTFPVTITAGA